MAKALYICYFGVRQPLVQTQVLPYLRELLKEGHGIALLTFEPSEGEGETEFAAIREKLAGEGLEWHCLPYHKWPSAIATAYDIIRGAWFIHRMIGKEEIDILHGRVHVPTLMGAIARKFSRRKPKLLFDIRGFFPEEYTDAGIWPEDGILYRVVKRIEKWLMKAADGFVVLTEKARVIVFPKSESAVNQAENPSAYAGGSDLFGRPVEVIPCCVDFEERFAVDRDALRNRIRGELNIDGRFVFVHAGVLGGLYLTEQIADFLQTARERDPKTFALFLTQSDPNLIVQPLLERGFAESDYFAGKVSPAEIPGYLCAADAGLSFVKAGYATQSRSPTKIPEYLACGLPIIANPGVGDVDELIATDRIGVFVKGFGSDNFNAAIDELNKLNADPSLAGRCRQSARKRFDLVNVGGSRYRNIYRRLSP